MASRFWAMLAVVGWLLSNPAFEANAQDEKQTQNKTTTTNLIAKHLR